MQQTQRSKASRKTFAGMLTALTVFCACRQKEQKVFTIDLPHYASKIELERINDYDTLLVWDWYNDNSASHRRCYRIQNAKRGIALENGMLPQRAKQLDQMTIKAPINPNKFPNWTIREWLKDNKELSISERPSDTVFKVDSLTIASHKFGIFGIKTIGNATKVVYMTNINHEAIEFEFYSNLYPKEAFYRKSLAMMKTLKIKQTR